MPIQIVPFKALYALKYEKEKTLILKTAQDNLIEIHHVGSTSVEGLAAKPVIDIIAVVKDISLFIKQIMQIGYEARGEMGIPFREYFRKDKKINLHAYENYSPEIKLNIAFRDYLRAHEKLRALYQELKYKLASNENAVQKTGNLYNNYNLGKVKFIREIIKQTGFNKLRLMFVNHFLEQEKFAAIYNKTAPCEDILGEEIKFILYQGMDIVAAQKIFIINDEVTIAKVAVDKEFSEINAANEITNLIKAWCKKHKLLLKLQ
jgi:GrpB-like predicted nucleotidyltransferase (UPF0157 family)